MSRLAKFLIFSSTLLILTSAYFSITGFAKLFSGEFYSIIILMSALEFSKITTTSFLFRYWKEENKILKIYLTAIIIILVSISSMGIFGFLSSAYSVTANKMSQIEDQTLFLEKQKLIYQQQIDRSGETVKNKSERITSLTLLRKDQEKRIDTLYKKNNVSGVKRVEQSIRDADKQIESFNREVDEIGKTNQPILDSISKIELKILELKNSDISGEIGPLKYVAILTNQKIERVVNFFIFLLIFVFDPLAILLVIATNKVLVRERVDNTEDIPTREEQQAEIDTWYKSLMKLREEINKYSPTLDDLNKSMYRVDKEYRTVTVKEDNMNEYKLPVDKSLSVRDNILKNYLKVCKEASEDNKIFNSFKVKPAYREVLEHLSKRLGLEHLKNIEESNKWLLKIESVWDNDKYGSPETEIFEHDGVEFSASPTTIQYLSVVSNLISIFKSLDGWNIIEIGGGYGGQCKVLQDVFEVNSYDIIDLQEAGMLQSKYLSTLNVKSFRTFLPTITLSENQSYDLVISNYALSEVSQEDQLNYVKNVLLKSKHGYITCNQKLNGEELLKEKFETFDTLADIKGERETNYVIVW